MPDPADGASASSTLDRAHVFHSWSAQAALNPMLIAGGEGSYVWDYDGNRYLDFSSQLVNVNIGHQHPKVVARDPGAGRAGSRPSRRSTPTTRAARRPSASSTSRPTGMSKVFFTNGGADANRERDPDGAPAHRARTRSCRSTASYHGNTGVRDHLDR